MGTSNKTISDFSILLIFVFFTIVGLSLLRFLPVKLTPSHQLPQLSVSYSMYGSSPAVVEMEVTSKLEALLARMSGVRKLSSFSGNGWGSISMEFDRHVDTDFARFEVSSIVRQAWPGLHDNVSYPSVRMQTANEKANPVFLSYSLVAPAAPTLLQHYAENTLKTKLADIEGIYQINVSGATPMEWQLTYDYEQLQRLGITVHEIRSAIHEQLLNENLGMVRFRPGENESDLFLPVSIVSPFNTTTNLDDALKDILIKKISSNRIIRLGDLVSLTRRESDPTSYYRINGNNTIYITLMAEATANQLEVAKQVKNKIAELQNDFPVGYELITAYDATDYIREEMKKIYYRTSLTIIALLLFVILVYRKLSYILLISFSLIITLAIAVIFYYLTGVEIQLYSLAGITISLTLIIDNTIILSDQLIHKGNKKAFLPILAASITTIGALTVIFFLDERIRLNLKDFAIVIMINLAVSLVVALFFVPALINRLGIRSTNASDKKRGLLSKNQSLRMLVHFNRGYGACILMLRRHRIIFFSILLLMFGLPVFLLPEKIDSDSRMASLYNSTIGSPFYKDNLKKHINQVFGGTWRLFAEKVYSGSYYEASREETRLYITATLPNGATLTQMNELIRQMERFIAQFEGVRQFETTVSNANKAAINIRFKRAYQQGGYPYQLKARAITKSIELGGGSWGVFGFGDGFSNEIYENAGWQRIVMYGYNYDELFHHALQLRTNLLQYRRIMDVTIDSEFSWYKSDYKEYGFALNQERLAQEGIQPAALFSALQPIFEKKSSAGWISNEGQQEQIVLRSEQSGRYSVWELENLPLNMGEKQIKLSELTTLEKFQTPQNIARENQQYRLCLQFDYIGAYDQAARVQGREVEAYSKLLPPGFSVFPENRRYDHGNSSGNGQYWLLAIVALIIFFSTGILFNSLRQPLLILFIIPLSFIGLFLSFYFFEVKFDQGGFAAFILLAGLTVNTNIYLIDEYNTIRHTKPTPALRAYLKAWNFRIRPIFLTIASTIIGFIPFVIGFRESFWFPLAVGTIGGLVVSLLMTFVCLPVVMPGIKQSTSSGLVL